MKKQLIKTLMGILCVIISFTSCPLNVRAEDINKITILGDSISQGYGLEENEKNYGMWLGEYFDASVSNYAVSGKTTQELIEQLDTNIEVIESVKSADLICVTIGGNDILHFIYEDLFNAANSYNSTSGATMGLSPESIENLIVSISTAIGPASITAGENTVLIADKLIELNPDAKLVFQTIYNPFESSNPDFKDMLPPLYTFASIYLSSINRPLMSNEKIICADIKSKFKGLCPYLTNMNKLDIHPNKTGQLVIAEEIVQQLKLTGNFGIFSEPFSDMTEGTPADIPQALKEEMRLISNGGFRLGEIPTEPVATQTTAKKTTSGTQTTEMSVKKNTETENKEIPVFIIYILIAAAFVNLIALITVITVKIRKNKRME